MNWITINDIEKQFGNKDLPRTKIDGEIVVDNEKTQEAIEQAELYFRQNLEAINIKTDKFEQPQIDEIKMHLLDYTRWIYSNKDLKMTEEIFERFKMAKQWLSDVKKGSIVLINIEQEEAVQSGFKTINLFRC